MPHAKTAVADGRWARVGSSNLNVASFVSNYEIDVTVEHAGIVREMESMFLADLENATEIVLNPRRRLVAEGPGPLALSGPRQAPGALRGKDRRRESRSVPGKPLTHATVHGIEQRRGSIVPGTFSMVSNDGASKESGPRCQG
jgi:phosphatidylserine/phosphatidylglycerophosphate/cardiolipin synthase-like enzyme